MREKMQRVITLIVNGREHEIRVGNGADEMPPCETLANTLRDRLQLTGTKIACGQGACGCCTVIVDGKAITSCLTLTLDCEDKQITTIEGLADAGTGKINALQQAFIDNCGYQCGFCTPGVIVTAQAFLEKNSNPTEEEVREALSGNFCRCGTHYTAVDSVMAYVRSREVQ